MNSAHETKEWHMPQVQNPCMAESPVTQSPQLQHYSPMPSMEHHYGQSFPPQGPMHPPVHHQLPPSANFLPSGKPESDPRLPGMMSLSQPGTPRPSHHPSPKKAHANYTTSSFHAAPYPHSSLARKRGRNELFSTELGPFFSSTKPFDNLYALDRSTLLSLRIQAKMDRGFFLADNDWTCYRRNYFQVSGAFGIQGLNHYYSDQETQCLVQVDGHFYPVHNFSMNISARVSNSDKKIELVQHTPKRDKGPQSTPVAKLIMPGGNLSMSSVGANQSIVTFERIQFKTATANNGKRRAAQQYYVCLVDLYAEIEGNKKVKIASCQSAPLVVRGRSPGHYSDNHDRYESNMISSTGAGPNSAAGGTGGGGPPPHHHPPPPPPPPPQHQHDDRFNAPFPRPPMTPPGVMGPEYGSPYPYQPYNNYPHYPMQPQQPQQGMMMNSTPPTPTSGPTSQQNGNNGTYLVPSMSSDPSSSESSSPDLYNHNGEYNHHRGPGSNNAVLHEETKLSHPQLPHPQQQQQQHHHHGMNMQMPMDNGEWHRGRMNSTGSHHQPSPAAVVYENQHNSYFSQPSTTNGSAFSNNSAPSTPYGGPPQSTAGASASARKFNSGSQNIQQQAS